MFICRPTGRVQVAIIGNSQLPIHNWQLAVGGKGDWLSHATTTTTTASLSIHARRRRSMTDHPKCVGGLHWRWLWLWLWLWLWCCVARPPPIGPHREAATTFAHGIYLKSKMGRKVAKWLRGVALAWQATPSSHPPCSIPYPALP